MDIRHMNIPMSYPRWVAFAAWIIDGTLGVTVRVCRWLQARRRRP